MRKREIFIVLSKKRKTLGSAESTFPYKKSTWTCSKITRDFGTCSWGIFVRVIFSINMLRLYNREYCCIQQHPTVASPVWTWNCIPNAQVFQGLHHSRTRSNYSLLDCHSGVCDCVLAAQFLLMIGCSMLQNVLCTFVSKLHTSRWQVYERIVIACRLRPTRENSIWVQINPSTDSTSKKTPTLSGKFIFERTWRNQSVLISYTTLDADTYRCVL